MALVLDECRRSDRTETGALLTHDFGESTSSTVRKRHLPGCLD